jgi:tRNA nucleotidyltransferase (CCA-adding enzyme)
MKITPLNDLPLLQETGALAAALGLECYAVGGCVRDWSMGLPSADIDFLLGGDTAPVAEGLVKKYGGTFNRFDRFFTTRVFLEGGRRVDLARFRKELYPRPAALPEVSAAGTAVEDLKRRDFSVNAVAVAILPDSFGSAVDPFGGLEDVKSRRVCVLHPVSFADDPTRLFRAARFAGRFDWQLEEETEELAKKCVKESVPALLSRERLRNELFKILEEKDPSAAFVILRGLDACRFLSREFIWPPGAAELAGAMPRLAAIAAAMGRDGAPFLESLKLPGKTVASIKRTVSGTYGKNL